MERLNLKVLLDVYLLSESLWLYSHSGIYSNEFVDRNDHDFLVNAMLTRVVK